MPVFNSIPIGQSFDHGGNIWRKRSGRTAIRTVTRGHDGGRWWVSPITGGEIAYFRQGERVGSESHWWQAMGVL
jgi:hypothetical protein